MSAKATPTGRKKLAQGKERSDAALGHDSTHTSSPEGAKEKRALPSGWEWKTVGEMVEEMQYGTSAKTSDDRTGVPVLRMGNIKDGCLVLDSLKYLPTDHEEFPSLLLRDGDLLFNRTNSAELVGKSAVYRGNPSPSCCASYLIRARLHLNYVPEFVAYYINSTFGRAWVSSVVSQQVGQANVNGTKLKALSVPVPSLPEQRRIVAEIEKQFTRLEAGVAALRRVQANLKRYRAAVLKAACEGKLVPTEAELSRSQPSTKNSQPAYEPASKLLARILAERRKNWTGRGKYKEPAAPDTANLPSLPEGWTYTSVESVGFVQLGRQRAPQHHNGANMRPYLRVANVFEDRIDLSDVMEMNFTPDEFETFQLKPNDILLNEGQSLELVGRPAIYKGELPGACFTNTLVRFRPCGSLDVKFALSVFRAFMHSGRFQKIAKWTTNIAHLGSDRFAKMAFPLPPLAEQTRIVAEVERRLSVVEELESVVSANLQRATRLRQSILRKAFTGNLTSST